MEKFRTRYAFEKPVPIKPKAGGSGGGGVPADRWSTLKGCSRLVGSRKKGSGHDKKTDSSFKKWKLSHGAHPCNFSSSTLTARTVEQMRSQRPWKSERGREIRASPKLEASTRGFVPWITIEQRETTRSRILRGKTGTFYR